MATESLANPTVVDGNRACDVEAPSIKSTHCLVSRFLYAVETDTGRFVGRLSTLAPGTCEDEIESLIAPLYREIGDDYVIYDSRSRPDFLPSHIPAATRKRGPEEKMSHQ